jgi:hypothetical protein
MSVIRRLSEVQQVTVKCHNNETCNCVFRLEVVLSGGCYNWVSFLNTRCRPGLHTVNVNVMWSGILRWNACQKSEMWLYNYTPWPEFASKLYRPSDCRLLAKLVPTFAARGCHMGSVTDCYGRNLDFLDQTLSLSLSLSLYIYIYIYIYINFNVIDYINV